MADDSQEHLRASIGWQGRAVDEDSSVGDEPPEIHDLEDQVQYAKEQFLDLAEELDHEGVVAYGVIQGLNCAVEELFDLGWDRVNEST